MSNFTVEQLINAIRTADSLSELKRMVGASEAQNEQSSKRISEIDRIGEKYGYDTNTMPRHVASYADFWCMEEKGSCGVIC